MSESAENLIRDPEDTSSYSSVCATPELRMESLILDDSAEPVGVMDARADGRTSREPLSLANMGLFVDTQGLDLPRIRDTVARAMGSKDGVFRDDSKVTPAHMDALTAAMGRVMEAQESRECL